MNIKIFKAERKMTGRDSEVKEGIKIGGGRDSLEDILIGREVTENHHIYIIVMSSIKINTGL